MRLPSRLAPAAALLAALLGLAGLRADAPQSPAPPGFDPARHMRVSEVRAGMTGYGLSVFKGTAIERFDVKVLSVLKNFSPKYDMVLIECKGANLEHTGSVAGMSGSPVFLRDDRGRDRMIGAFAYGWPMVKDPVAGVQPIEYMLAIPDAAPPAGPAIRPSAQARIHWSFADATPLPTAAAKATSLLSPAPRLGDGSLPRLRPLATPLMAGGFSPKLLASLAPAFAAANLVPMAAGGTTTQLPPGAAKIEPGSVLAVPLITGDADMTAVGTCTEVIGDRVWGFGHPFNNEGPVSLPMGAGQISAVIADLNTSFKIGSMTQVRGTLLADQTSGVAGRLGPAPATVPLDLTVVYADGSLRQTYHFDLALHPKLTPVLAAAAIGSALGGVKELPQYHTLDYDLDLAFANGKSLHLANSVVNAGPPELFQEVGLPITLAADNPFERVPLKNLRGTIRVTPEAREAHIQSVSVPRLKYPPGETAKVYVTYRPFRAAEAILPLEFEIPRELPDGAYQLSVSDYATYLEAEKEARPWRFTAESADEIFAAMKDVLSLRHNAIYMQLMRKADGVAVGRVAMPHLPSSRRQILLGSGSSDVTQFVSSKLKVVPTELVMEGAAVFTITVERADKGGAVAPKVAH